MMCFAREVNIKENILNIFSFKVMHPFLDFENTLKLSFYENSICRRKTCTNIHYHALAAPSQRFVQSTVLLYFNQELREGINRE